MHPTDIFTNMTLGKVLFPGSILEEVESHFTNNESDILTIGIDGSVLDDKHLGLLIHQVEQIREYIEGLTRTLGGNPDSIRLVTTVKLGVSALVRQFAKKHGYDLVILDFGKLEWYENNYEHEDEYYSQEINKLADAVVVFGKRKGMAGNFIYQAARNSGRYSSYQILRT